MIKHGKAVLLAALLVPGAVFANMDLGQTLGTSDAQIRSALEAQGYTITEIEREDGEIEVEASKNGQAFEFELAPDTGMIIEISLELDEDDDDDDEKDS